MAACAAFMGDYPALMASLLAIYAIALLGADLLVGYAGVNMLGLAAPFGAGAYAAALATTKLGAPMGVGLAAGVACGVLAALAMSLPAMKASPQGVALSTLVLGNAFELALTAFSGITNGSSGVSLGQREIFGHPFGALDHALIALGFLALCSAALDRIAASSIGRSFEALRDSPIAAEFMGISKANQKRLAFALCGVFCGLAGALFAYAQGYIAPSSFGFETSICMLLAAIVGGKKSRFGAMAGAAVEVYLPLALNSVIAFRAATGLVALALCILAGRKAVRGAAKACSRAGRWTWRDIEPGLIACAFSASALFAASFMAKNMADFRLPIYGMLILGSLYFLESGLAGVLPKARRKLDTMADPSPLQSRSELVGIEALSLEGVAIEFNGVRALDGADLRLVGGSVVGLVGPNGAGKSTAVNVISGLYEPCAGTFQVGGRDAKGWGRLRMADEGVARTFQNIQLFHGLTAIENVLCGMREEHESNPFKIALGLGSSKDAACLARAKGLLEFVGLADHAESMPSELPYASRRALEIARALARRPKVLLLDEPAAGVPESEHHRLAELIGAVAKTGVAVLVIEHHMDLIKEVCDQAVVFVSGKPMASGTPEEALGRADVIAAYLE